MRKRSTPAATDAGNCFCCDARSPFWARPHPAIAQDGFPIRPIRLIVPYHAGRADRRDGPAHRPVAVGISGQQVYVDNRPGAGSTLGGKLAAGADPDGYTLLVASAATLAIGPALYPDAGFDPKVFVPVGLFATVPFLMIAGTESAVGERGRRDRLRQGASRQAHHRRSERRPAAYAGSLV